VTWTRIKIKTRTKTTTIGTSGIEIVTTGRRSRTADMGEALGGLSPLAREVPGTIR